MEKPMYPAPSSNIAKKRRELAPEILDAFQTFSLQVFSDGALQIGRAHV